MGAADCVIGRTALLVVVESLLANESVNVGQAALPVEKLFSKIIAGKMINLAILAAWPVAKKHGIILLSANSRRCHA
jgi:hypothetical protein